jgi:hypothetical protein
MAKEGRRMSDSEILAERNGEELRMSEERTFKTRWKYRPELIRGIADDIDVYLQKQEDGLDSATCGNHVFQELHTLRGYCEQLQIVAGELERGEADWKGTKEL